MSADLGPDHGGDVPQDGAEGAVRRGSLLVAQDREADTLRQQAGDPARVPPRIRRPVEALEQRVAAEEYDGVPRPRRAAADIRDPAGKKAGLYLAPWNPAPLRGDMPGSG